MNSFGKIFTLTTFGESHGPAIGGVIDGLPANMELSLPDVQRELNRRRPGRVKTEGEGADGEVAAIGSARKEPDAVEFLSGIFEGKTLGTPIGFVIRNSDAHSADYEALRDLFRPSHADYTYQAKYGVRDYRGGGRASARETACRVVAGALARQCLAREGITVSAYTSQIGGIKIDDTAPDFSLSTTYAAATRCPSPAGDEQMRRLLARVAAEGDTIGGCVSCVVNGVPAGVGSPLYDKLQAQLAAAMLSIPAAKGFDYGLGFRFAESRGSEVADLFKPSHKADGPLQTATNFSGGIQGGIANGMPIYFRVAFKPAATMMRPLTCSTSRGECVTLNVGGRHDVCVVPIAVPVVEAMACITLLDALLFSKAQKL
jgi:chorismate synthase